jgi:hypothetical protein
MVALPRFSGPVTLDITVEPRTSINFDTTLLGFVGATEGAVATP